MDLLTIGLTVNEPRKFKFSFLSLVNSDCCTSYKFCRGMLTNSRQYLNHIGCLQKLILNLPKKSLCTLS